MIPPTEKYDATNDIILTNKFRLNMNAKVNDQLSFTGRLAAYKVFRRQHRGQGQPGQPGGRDPGRQHLQPAPRRTPSAWSGPISTTRRIWARVPTNFSLGRRPSTDGPPTRVPQQQPRRRVPAGHDHQLAVRRRLLKPWAGRGHQHSRQQPSSCATAWVRGRLGQHLCPGQSAARCG
jgi:hypothetical protein